MVPLEKSQVFMAVLRLEFILSLVLKDRELQETVFDSSKKWNCRGFVVKLCAYTIVLSLRKLP